MVVFPEGWSVVPGLHLPTLAQGLIQLGNSQDGKTQSLPVHFTSYILDFISDVSQCRTQILQVCLIYMSLIW